MSRSIQHSCVPTRSFAGHNPRCLRPVLPCFLLVLLSLGSIFVMSSAAQQTRPSRDNKSDQPQTEQQDQNEHHNKSLAGELARETREAAGEDENAQFKKSASIKWVANKTGLSDGQVFWISVFLNFGVVAAVIIWISKKVLPRMFRDRTSSIQRSMEEARKTSADASRRLAEIEARLSRLDVDISEMREQAAKESVAEEARIKAAAEEDSRKIVESAEQEIAAAVKQARRELAAYAADLAISQAQSALRVDADTDEALVRGFAQQISASNSNHSGPVKGGS